MDIITILKDEHAQCKALFERLDATTTRAHKTRTALLAKIDHDLRLHMRFEEEHLYPAIAGCDDASEETRDLTHEAKAEHQAARDALDRLAELATDDTMWKAWSTVLSEEIEHHVEEEETDLFVRARELLDRKRLVAMGEEYTRWKKEAPTPDAPEPERMHVIGLA